MSPTELHDMAARLADQALQRFTEKHPIDQAATYSWTYTENDALIRAAFGTFIEANNGEPPDLQAKLRHISSLLPPEHQSLAVNDLDTAITEIHAAVADAHFALGFHMALSLLEQGGHHIPAFIRRARTATP